MYVREDENVCANVLTATEVGILITGGTGVSWTDSLLTLTGKGS